MVNSRQRKAQHLQPLAAPRCILQYDGCRLAAPPQQNFTRAHTQAGNVTQTQDAATTGQRNSRRAWQLQQHMRVHPPQRKYGQQVAEDQRAAQHG